MATWEDAFDSLGPAGKQIKADFKRAFKSIKGDMSTFLRAEADRVKSWLDLFEKGEISKRTLGILMDSEKQLIQQHVLMNSAESVAGTEKAVGKLMIAALDRLLGNETAAGDASLDNATYTKKKDEPRGGTNSTGPKRA